MDLVHVLLGDGKGLRVCEATRDMNRFPTPFSTSQSERTSPPNAVPRYPYVLACAFRAWN